MQNANFAKCKMQMQVHRLLQNIDAHICIIDVDQLNLKLTNGCLDFLAGWVELISQRWPTDQIRIRRCWGFRYLQSCASCTKMKANHSPLSVQHYAFPPPSFCSIYWISRKLLLSIFTGLSWPLSSKWRTFGHAKAFCGKLISTHAFPSTHQSKSQIHHSKYKHIIAHTKCTIPYTKYIPIPLERDECT